MVFFSLEVSSYLGPFRFDMYSLGMYSLGSSIFIHSSFLFNMILRALHSWEGHCFVSSSPSKVMRSKQSLIGQGKTWDFGGSPTLLVRDCP